MKKLLILGAGGHGRVCAEIAEECDYEVSFLDDSSSSDILGCLDLYEKMRLEYDTAFVALGNPEIREKWFEKLKAVGYKIDSLISGKAVVSDSATIKEGSIIMPGAIVQSNAVIGKGSIISAGAVIDHDAVIGDFCHVNCNAVVASMSEVKEKTKIDYGDVWKNV